MNWSRALIAGVVGGVVMNFASFVIHGFILANTYTRYAVFTQEQANPLHFFLVAGARDFSRAGDVVLLPARPFSSSDARRSATRRQSE